MERDPFEGGADVGRDNVRDLGDEPPAAIRDARPTSSRRSTSRRRSAGTPRHPNRDRLGRRFPGARLGCRPASSCDPHSGRSAPAASRSTRSTVIRWLSTRCRAIPAAARRRPGRTAGRLHDGRRRLRHRRERRSPAVVGHRAGPAAGRRDAPTCGRGRRTRPGPTRPPAIGALISSETGDGIDAVRILLPDAIDHLTRELGGEGRVLVGIPERHLLLAATLRPDDAGFAALFARVRRSSSRAVPTSRSTAACSSSSTAAWSSSLETRPRDRRPARRGRRAGRDNHARPAGSAQCADRADEARPARGAGIGSLPTVTSGSSS